MSTNTRAAAVVALLAGWFPVLVGVKCPAVLVGASGCRQAEVQQGGALESAI